METFSKSRKFKNNLVSRASYLFDIGKAAKVKKPWERGRFKKKTYTSLSKSSTLMRVAVWDLRALKANHLLYITQI